MSQGVVSILGRPNVGKSTLYNRLTRGSNAIVDDMPGVTRDRLYGSVWLDRERTQGFTLVDTGGFETKDFNFQPFKDNIVWRQTEAAVASSDLVLLVLDGRAGLHPHDEELVRYLKRLDKPFTAVINKLDGVEQEVAVGDFYRLGIDTFEPISAAHNRGVGELREQLGERLAAITGSIATVDPGAGVPVAIIGKPNAGKSSILNRLAGEERALVSELAGTTRDSVDIRLTFEGQTFTLIDTAGMRRKTKVDTKLESASVIRSIRAIDLAEIVILVIDATEGLTDQDARLATLAAGRHKAVIIVVNKWDLIPDKDSNSSKAYAEALRSHLRTLAYAPITFVSCLTNQRVHALPKLLAKVSASYGNRVNTAAVNEVLQKAVGEHTPALIRSHTKRVKFFYGSQVAVRPPTIVVFCNVKDEIQESYKRYMLNKFRSGLGFGEVPIRLLFRSKEEQRRRDEQAHSKV